MKLTLFTSQKPSLTVGSSLYLKKVWMGIEPAFPERCFLVPLATLWQSLWKHTSLTVIISKHLTLAPCFLARPMKYFRSSALGLVLSMTTLLPWERFSSATLQHFSFVFRVSLLTRTYSGRKLVQKVDLPEPGPPTMITSYLGSKATLLPLPMMTSPSSGTVVGLNPFTSSLSTWPKNRHQGVKKGMPTFKANLQSESEKSLCLPSFLPAASPQQQLTFISTFCLSLNFSVKRVHMPVPGFLNSSSWDATKTCISTPKALATLATLVLMCSALVCPFWMPAWLVKMIILKPSSENLLTLGATLSLRMIQSSASLGNLAPLFLVMMVSSMSKEATLAECLRPGDDPTRHVPCWTQFH